MRYILIALGLALVSSASSAQQPAQDTLESGIAGPREVGTTTMPPGSYHIVEQTTRKAFTLTVTQKGNMILGAASADLELRPKEGVAAPTNASINAASIYAARTDATETAPVGMQQKRANPLTGLMQQGMQKGMSQLLKQGASKQLTKFLPIK